MVRKKHSSTPSSTTSDLSDDLDTEEALKGFDFLASPDELDGSPESRSGDDSGEWGESPDGFQSIRTLASEALTTVVKDDSGVQSVNAGGPAVAPCGAPVSCLQRPAGHWQI